MGDFIMKKQKIICICGRKNMGKTTLMEKLIGEFTDRGYKVAAIKHDGHDFEPDVEGTDSFRFAKAGAYGTAVFSKNRVMMIKQIQQIKEKSICLFYPEADFILVEGLKNSSYPKIEIVRKGVSKEHPLLCSNPEGRFLVATDLEVSEEKELEKEELCDITDYTKMIERILNLL